MTKQDEQEGGVATAISEAYGKMTETVTSAYATARDKAADMGQGTASTIDASPVLALLGGLAVGALAGALVPRGGPERELLAPVGGRLAEAAKAALAAARAAGGEALTDAGISQDNLRVQSSRLFEELLKAAGAAGSAAVSAAREGAAR